MPRSRNAQPTVKVTISTSPALFRDLEKVVATGYFGNTRSEAAERLLAEAIRNLIREGTLVRKPPADL
jgi:cytochrome c-type biogenesis protein CcmE